MNSSSSRDWTYVLGSGYTASLGPSSQEAMNLNRNECPLCMESNFQFTNGFPSNYLRVLMSRSQERMTGWVPWPHLTGEETVRLGEKYDWLGPMPTPENGEIGIQTCNRFQPLPPAWASHAVSTVPCDLVLWHPSSLRLGIGQFWIKSSIKFCWCNRRSPTGPASHPLPSKPLAHSLAS